MDLLLIHPNDQKNVYGDTLKYTACEPPFWCAIAAQFALDNKLEVMIIDAEAENISAEEVSERVCEINPTLIGIFVTGTNLSASTQKMQGADYTCSAIKSKCPGIQIFYWGLHPSALPERTLRENEADYIIVSEGYETIVNLCKYCQGDSNLFDEKFLGGLVYRDGDKIERFRAARLMSTDELPLPAWKLLPMDKYMPHNWHIMGENDPKDAKGRYGVISTSIGCPFNCSFCAISSLFGTKKVRFWDIDRVVQEIERLVMEYNVKYIKILDECFVLNRDYVMELCDKIAVKKFDLNMWGYARIDTVDETLLKRCKQAGINWLAYGIESGDDSVLNGVQKAQYGSERIKQVIQWTKDAGINVIANFMFGLPDDTMESMRKSLELCKTINPEWINFYVTMPYPGSRDYFKAEQAGKIKEDKWIQYAQYSYECIPGGGYLSPEDILRFRDNAFNEFFKNNDRYFGLIRQKFGEQYVNIIKDMTKTKLKRKLLSD